MRTRQAAPVQVDGVAIHPALRDPAHEAWKSQRAAVKLAGQLGVDARMRQAEFPESRRVAVLTAWAVAQGMTLPGFPRLPDQAAMQRLGIRWPHPADRVSLG